MSKSFNIHDSEEKRRAYYESEFDDLYHNDNLNDWMRYMSYREAKELYIDEHLFRDNQALEYEKSKNGSDKTQKTNHVFESKTIKNQVQNKLKISKPNQNSVFQNP